MIVTQDRTENVMSGTRPIWRLIIQEYLIRKLGGSCPLTAERTRNGTQD